MSTIEVPENPAQYIQAARFGLSSAGMTTQFKNPTDAPPEVIAGIIVAQAIDRQTNALVDVLREIGGPR